MRNLLLFTLSFCIFSVLTLWWGGVYAEEEYQYEVFYNALTDTKICIMDNNGTIYVIKGNWDIVSTTKNVFLNPSFSVPVYTIYTNDSLYNLLEPSVIIMK